MRNEQPLNLVVRRLRSHRDTLIRICQFRVVTATLLDGAALRRRYCFEPAFRSHTLDWVLPLDYLKGEVSD